jgi:hypothetical protein
MIGGEETVDKETKIYYLCYLLNIILAPANMSFKTSFLTKI